MTAEEVIDYCDYSTGWPFACARSEARSRVACKRMGGGHWPTAQFRPIHLLLLASPTGMSFRLACLVPLSCFTDRRSVRINKFICRDASRLANPGDRISCATIKIVQSLQRTRSVLGCFRMNSFLEALAQGA